MSVPDPVVVTQRLNEPGAEFLPSPESPVTLLEVRVVTGSGGGPDKTILNSPRFLDPHGFRTICAYLHPPDDPGFEVLQRRAAALGTRLVSIPDRGPFDWSVMRALEQLCREENVAIWHGHDYKSNVLGVWIRRKWPMRMITTAHGWVDRHWKAPLYDAIDRWSLKFYERVLCVSDDLVETCLRSGIRQDRLRLIENGIDTEFYQRRRSITEARAAWEWPESGLVLGAIGRLSDEKGFDLLIEAVRTLQLEFPGLQLVIAGDGPRRAALQEQIDRHQLGASVRLLGFCEDVRSMLEAVDVFVLSSRREGLPNVVLEAMAMNVPIVSTRVAGVPKVLTDGVNGILAETDDLESLTSALRRTLSDVDLQRRIAHAGRDTVVHKHSFAVRMDRIRKIYLDLLTLAGRRD